MKTYRSALTMLATASVLAALVCGCGSSSSSASASVSSKYQAAEAIDSDVQSAAKKALDIAKSYQSGDTSAKDAKTQIKALVDSLDSESFDYGTMNKQILLCMNDMVINLGTEALNEMTAGTDESGASSDTSSADSALADNITELEKELGLTTES
ncbi:MAG: hypothetical protein ACI4D6_12000 [Chordicoccus sp.]